MKILLVEDDEITASFIKKGLKQAGFSVEHSADGEDGLFHALHEPYDAAVIDIMLPKLDGLSLINEIRTRKVTTPVLVLSAKNTVDDRVRGLQTGGDDLTVGDLSMDLLRRKVIRGGEEIELQPREFALLEYLMRNAGRVVSKTMIMEHVWDYNFDPHTNVVEARICRLRDKIDLSVENKLIHTIRGVGYVLEERK